MGVPLFSLSMFIFVFIYGCQLRDVTPQSEALFGAKVNASTTTRWIVGQGKLSIFGR